MVEQLKPHIKGNTYNGMHIVLAITERDNVILDPAEPIDLTGSEITATFRFGSQQGALNQIKYIDTGLDLSTTSEFGQDDCSFGMHVLTNIGSNGYVYGIKAGTNLGTYCGVNVQDFMNSNGAAILGTSGRMFNILTRNNSATFDKIYNGVKYTYTAASTTKQSSTMKLGAFAQPGSTHYLTLYGYFVGKSLDASQEAILRGAWSTLMTKILR